MANHTMPKWWKKTATTSRSSVPRPDRAPTFRPRLRFLRGVMFFLGVVFHAYIWEILLTRLPLTRWYAQRTMLNRWLVVARRFRKIAVEMGGMQIKFGQFLSARADIIPEEIRHELSGLQDEVPAAPAGHVLNLIMEEHGLPPDKLFHWFNQEVEAAASLGQVHFATLHDGQEVAVKVQRPNIEQILDVDLNALEWVLRIIKDYPFVKRRVDVMALFEEFSRVLRKELDYIQEAQNALNFRKNFAGMIGVYFPYPIMELTTRRVLVMERISGIKINNKAALQQAGVNIHDMTERLNQSYLKQFFLDGFFHADPHPGNLFIHVHPDVPQVDAPRVDDTDHMGDIGGIGGIGGIGNADSWSNVSHNGDGAGAEAGSFGATVTPRTNGTPFTIIFVDFGMVGNLPPQTMEIVRSALLGLATNDAERIVQSLFNLKMFLPGVDQRPIVQAIQVLLRHTYDLNIRDLTNMDVENVFDEIRDIVYDLPFQIPQNLLYLGRAVSMVTGLMMDLNPEMNLFESMRPFALRVLQREEQNGDWLERIGKEIRELGQIILTLPRQMDTYYKAANRGELQTRTDLGRMERLLRRMEYSTERLTGGVVATGLFLGGVQLRTRGLEKESKRAWMAAAVALLWTMRPRNENGSRRGGGGFGRRDR
jgi:predicted unusual protein kinase regulating ubiquinone biosynthesis (AarF/ABC1/UbiB family)